MENQNAGTYSISESAIIPARRERVYSILANYNDGHPRILPKQFNSLVVEQGGVGAGTVIRFRMNVLGKTQNFHGEISEPEPGRILVEKYLEPQGIVTTFTIDPGTAPADCRVTISTTAPVPKGFRGVIEKALSPLLLRPIFRQELANLARVATGPFAR